MTRIIRRKLKFVLIVSCSLFVAAPDASARDDESRQTGANQPSTSKPNRSFAFVEHTRSVEMLFPGVPVKNRITKKDMEAIVELKPRKLLADYVVIDSEAKALFGSLIDLRELVVPRSNFGDDEFKMVAKYKDLEFANLIDTDVTDEIVEVFGQCGKLRMIFVNGTAISSEGYRRMKQIRPETQVFWGPIETPRFREKKSAP